VVVDLDAVDPLRRREVLAVRGPLDVGSMNQAAAALVGLNDFAAFCKRREGATTVRTLIGFSWAAEPEDERCLVASVVADAFCHSMVRALVGAVLDVGRGRRPPHWPAELLAARVRDSSAPVAPAHGLCLEEVTYPPDDQLAQRVSQAKARREMMP
jgi:tRNA pseudouridine38-40 synthase